MAEPLSQPADAPEPPAADVADAMATDVEQFIYLISHDLRSSVRALLELPQWVAEDLEDAGFEMTGPVADALALMERHSRRLDRMLVDLLTHSRIGRLQAVRAVNFNDVLDKIEAKLALAPNFLLERSLVCDSCRFGERDIQTLLFALIENAVKHHDQSQGQIRVASWTDGHQVVLTVTDNGPGIAAAFHDQVFRPMTTLRSRDDVEGSGLGLANVRKIAAAYRGGARILPSESRGTCIEVRFTPAPAAGEP